MSALGVGTNCAIVNQTTSRNPVRDLNTRSHQDQIGTSTVPEVRSQPTAADHPSDASHDTASPSSLPSTVPETLPVDVANTRGPVAVADLVGSEARVSRLPEGMPALRKEEEILVAKQSMSSQGSDNATQPISQSVFEEVIRSRSEALLSDPENREEASIPFAVGGGDIEGTADTQFTATEGDTGFLDLVSSLAAPQADLESIPVNFSPIQSQLPLTQFPESQRFKTPATAGKKRDHNGNVLDTPVQARNPLVRGDHATPNNLLGLSQAFAATQAASSPFQVVPTSALRSDRPSPQVEVQFGVENLLTSSPLRPLPDIKRPATGAATEPATFYLPIGQSQDRRRDSTDDGDVDGDRASQATEEEDSEIEPSIVVRKRREKQRDARARQQLQSASSPGSPKKLHPGRILDPRLARSASERPPTTRQKSFPSSPPQIESAENDAQEEQCQADSTLGLAEASDPRAAAMSSSEPPPPPTHVESSRSSMTLVPNTTRRATRQSTRSVRNVEPSPSVHRTRQEQETQAAKRSSPQPIRIANSQVSAPSTQTATTEGVGPSSGHESVDVIPASQVPPQETTYQKHSAQSNGPLICRDKPNPVVPETSSAVAVQVRYPSSPNQGEQSRSAFTNIPLKQPPEPSAKSIESSQPIRTTPPGRKRKRMTEMSQDIMLPSATQSSSFDAAEALALDRSPQTARILAAAHEHNADSDPIVQRKRRKATGGGMHISLLDVEDTRTPLASATNANIGRRLSSRNTEPSDNDASSVLSSPIPSSGQVPEGVSNGGATHKTPTQKPKDSIWEMDKSPKPRLVPPALQSQTQSGPETKRSKGMQRPRKSPSTAAVKTPMNLPIPLPPIEEASPDPLAIGMRFSTPATPDTTSERIVAPNMIFAYYMGRTRAYYPAVCLGFMEETQQCKIKWLGYDAENVARHGVCSLDLRVGDEVKVDREGFPRTAFTIISFETAIPYSSDENSITDVYGHTRVRIVPKQRKKLVSKPVAAREDIVPISSLYIELTTWNRISKRPFVYTSTAVTENKPLVSTPLNQQTTPGTPSSKSRNSVRDTSVLPQNKTGMFGGMVFALSFDDTTRDRIATLVHENGGTILPDSFTELFDNGLDLKADFTSAGFTAFLTNEHSRRKKYMQALALGLPCLHGKWVQACVGNSTHVNHWQDYLLPAGESAELAGAVRSRILPCSIDINHTTLRDIVDSRSQFFTQQTQIVFVTGRSKAGPKPHLFFVRAMADASCTVETAADLNAASECLRKLDRTRRAWLIVDNNKKDIDAAHALVEEIMHGPADTVVSRGPVRRKTGGTGVHLVSTAAEWNLQVADSEFVMQSLILGRLCSRQTDR